MSTKIVAIDKTQHKNWKIKGNDLSNTSTAHVCPAFAHEYPQIAAEYPIVFVKDSDSDTFRSVAMLGLKPGQNVFFQSGKWMARYVPAALRAYPFVVAPIPEKKGQAAVCLDQNSDLILQSAEKEGQALFDAEGNPSEFLQKMNGFLSTLMAQGEFTDKFVTFLAKNKLLEEQAMNVNLNDGTKHRLTSVYRINEKKFNELKDKDFIALRKLGYLPAIYAHLLSLGQVNNLSRLYDQLPKEVH